MNEYQPTPKQEQALREYLHEAVVPLIEDVLVKKLGQAMAFLKEQQQPEQEPRCEKCKALEPAPWLARVIGDGGVCVRVGSEWLDAKLVQEIINETSQALAQSDDQAMVFLKEQQQREQPLGFNVVIKETKTGGEFRVVSIDPITSVEK